MGLATEEVGFCNAWGGICATDEVGFWSAWGSIGATDEVGFCFAAVGSGMQMALAEGVK